MTIERWLTVTPFLFFWGMGGLFSLAEAHDGSRPVDRRKEWKWDVIAYGCAIIAGGALLKASQVGLSWLDWIRPDLRALPGGIRFLASFVLADVLRYWTHRWMHSSSMWPIHKWHHAPQELWWFSGNRASLPHLVLLVMPAVVTGWFFDLGLVQDTVTTCLLLLWNHIMHTSAQLGDRVQRAFETVVVTPRFHRCHHARIQALYRSNLGSVFTVWDRMFGTFVDPDHCDYKSVPIGLSEAEAGSRTIMLLGLRPMASTPVREPEVLSS